MSLKAFHILFIALSTMLAVGFGVWSVRMYAAAQGGGYMVMGVLSFACAVALLVYGYKFWQKLRHIPLR